MKNQEPVKFIIKKIKTEQFAIFEENFGTGQIVELKTKVQFKLNREAKNLGVYVGFTFEQGKSIFLKIEVSCHFNIKEDSWKNFVETKTSKIIIPQDFLTHLTMITVGTARGILFAKTEGTNFNKFIIPTINVKRMLTKDAQFPLKKSNAPA